MVCTFLCRCYISVLFMSLLKYFCARVCASWGGAERESGALAVSSCLAQRRAPAPHLLGRAGPSSGQSGPGARRGADRSKYCRALRDRRATALPCGAAGAQNIPSSLVAPSSSVRPRQPGQPFLRGMGLPDSAASQKSPGHRGVGTKGLALSWLQEPCLESGC